MAQKKKKTLMLVASFLLLLSGVILLSACKRTNKDLIKIVTENKGDNQYVSILKENGTILNELVKGETIVFKLAIPDNARLVKFLVEGKDVTKDLAENSYKLNTNDLTSFPKYELQLEYEKELVINETPAFNKLLKLTDKTGKIITKAFPSDEVVIKLDTLESNTRFIDFTIEKEKYTLKQLQDGEVVVAASKLHSKDTVINLQLEQEQDLVISELSEFNTYLKCYNHAGEIITKAFPSDTVVIKCQDFGTDWSFVSFKLEEQNYTLKQLQDGKVVVAASKLFSKDTLINLQLVKLLKVDVKDGLDTIVKVTLPAGATLAKVPYNSEVKVELLTNSFNPGERPVILINDTQHVIELNNDSRVITITVKDSTTIDYKLETGLKVTLDRKNTKFFNADNTMEITEVLYGEVLGNIIIYTDNQNTYIEKTIIDGHEFINDGENERLKRTCKLTFNNPFYNFNKFNVEVKETDDFIPITLKVNDKEVAINDNNFKIKVGDFIPLDISGKEVLQTSLVVGKEVTFIYIPQASYKVTSILYNDDDEVIETLNSRTTSVKITRNFLKGKNYDAIVIEITVVEYEINITGLGKKGDLHNDLVITAAGNEDIAHYLKNNKLQIGDTIFLETRFTGGLENGYEGKPTYKGKTLTYNDSYEYLFYQTNSAGVENSYTMTPRGYTLVIEEYDIAISYNVDHYAEIILKADDLETLKKLTFENVVEKTYNDKSGTHTYKCIKLGDILKINKPNDLVVVKAVLTVDKNDSVNITDSFKTNDPFTQACNFEPLDLFINKITIEFFFNSNASVKFIVKGNTNQTQDHHFNLKHKVNGADTIKNHQFSDNDKLYNFSLSGEGLEIGFPKIKVGYKGEEHKILAFLDNPEWISFSINILVGVRINGVDYTSQIQSSNDEYYYIKIIDSMLNANSSDADLVIEVDIICCQRTWHTTPLKRAKDHLKEHENYVNILSKFDDVVGITGSGKQYELEETKFNDLKAKVSTLVNNVNTTNETMTKANAIIWGKLYTEMLSLSNQIKGA